MTRILVVEDDSADAVFLERAFQRAGLTTPRFVAVDGDVAIAYVEGSGPYADRAAYPPADRMLLDLKLPRRSGLDVLRWVRASPEHHNLPVIVFTSSGEPEDIEAATQLGVDGFLTKPLGFAELELAVQRIVAIWALR